MPRSPGSHAQGVRLIQLLRRLQGHQDGVRLADLEADFGVSRSQLRRDLLALEEAAIRVEIEQEHGRYGHARARLLDADSTSIPVTRTERYALLAARGFFRMFEGSHIHDDMEALFDKVRDTLPTRSKRDLRTLEEKIIVLPSGGTKNYRDRQHLVDNLLTGVLMERHVEFAYRQRSGRASRGVLAPFALVLHRNGLYVIAQRLRDDHGAEIQQEPRVFAVERFTEARWLRGTRSEIPADLDLDDYFDGFGLISGSRRHDVIVDLAKSVRADALARTWIRNQRTTALPDGRVRIEFSVTSLRDVVAWVLEWGPAAHVISPTELRDRVVKALRDSLANYQR